MNNELAKQLIKLKSLTLIKYISFGLKMMLELCIKQTFINKGN